MGGFLAQVPDVLNFIFTLLFKVPLTIHTVWFIKYLVFSRLNLVFTEIPSQKAILDVI